MSGRRSATERQRSTRTWRDGDLVWLGLLLSCASAALVLAPVWWLVS